MRLVSRLSRVAVLAAISWFGPASLAAQNPIEVNTASDVAPADDGVCTLREAITAANGNVSSGALGGECAAGSIVDPDTINFNISGGGSTQTIQPTSALPTITAGIYIDGFSQGCASGPCIELDGTSAGVGANGIRTSGDGSTIRGLVINRFSSSAILIQGSNNTVEGNYLGTNLAGAVASGNNVGVAVTTAATGNLIGGVNAASRNIMSGNGNGGVAIFGAGVSMNTVSGNYIGTDVTGTSAIPNGTSGVTIRNEASDNLVGGTTSGAGNLVSGNGFSGVSLQDSVANNRIEGNLIGTDATGTSSIPNREGVFLSQGANRNVIGGTTSGARNLISGNNGEGLRIQGAASDSNRVEGNFIGTDITGSTALQNGGNGVELALGAQDNIVGGSTAGAQNLISGNSSFGVSIGNAGTSGNRVTGNQIGTDVTGTVAVQNGSYGVSVGFEATGNFVGGAGAGEGNLLSGNTLGGIQIFSAGTSGNFVHGNLIGTDVTSTSPLANGEGMRITQSADSNFVGGAGAGEGNTIAFNTNDGVVLGSSAGLMNAILGNSIFSNGGLGIDLNDDGVTPNDGGDIDASPNQLQNFPVIQGDPSYDTNTNELTVTYLVDSDPANASYPLRVEFFIADGDIEEGQTFLGFDEYESSDFAGGNKTVSFVTTVPVDPGDDVLATATDSLGNTSEFSMAASGLPVELASFEGVIDDERVILTWRTSSETNNAGFEVGMRADRSWSRLGFVEGSGTTSAPNDYRFETERLRPGAYAFRLKQIDFDGRFEYGPIIEVAVEVPLRLELQAGYPNPFNQTTMLSFTVPSDGDAELVVFNPLGREVTSLFDGRATAGTRHQIRFDAAGLATGPYIAVLRFNGRRQSTTMILSR